MDAKKAERFKIAFKSAAELSYTVFGNNAFRRFSYGNASNPAGHWERSSALYDVTMWGFSQFEKRQIVPVANQIREALIKTVNLDDSFKEAVISSTGDRSKAQYRFEAWKRRLASIIGVPQGERRFFSRAEKIQLFEESQSCAICGNVILDVDTHVDYRIPYSRGGTTSMSKAQLTHRFYNRSKSAS